MFPNNIMGENGLAQNAFKVLKLKESLHSYFPTIHKYQINIKVLTEKDIIYIEVCRYYTAFYWYNT